ncbi:MAG: aldehyde dehydrogenase family protein, partial [Deltaproteobacteria bacterium]|nr:aldehyde dehydrogenase family protein [Deltaproteobacteria bacterium]
VIPIIYAVDYFLKVGPRYLKDETIRPRLLFQKKSKICYEPYGVILIISPWNYPFGIPMGEIILALLCGNAVILKPSEYVDPVSRCIQSIFSSLDLPRNLFQVAYGDAALGAELVGHAGIDKISFTGSTRAGQKILESAAHHITPCIMELGGKDAAIVLKDADLKTTVSGIVWGGFTNAGQVCGSIQRVYVHRSIVQPFVEAVVKQTENLKMVDDIASIVLPAQLDRYEAQLKEALEKGAKILIGGRRQSIQGRNYFEPTVLINVTDEMSIVKEETFGPFLPILMFDDEQEVISRVNHSPYGLCASIWTQNKQKGFRLAKKIEAATVTVNDCLFTHAMCETPWGGYKYSGMGRVHGKWGFYEYCQVKHISVDRISLKPFWWFPYTAYSDQVAQELADHVAADTKLDKIKTFFRFMMAYLFR